MKFKIFAAITILTVLGLAALLPIVCHAQETEPSKTVSDPNRLGTFIEFLPDSDHPVESEPQAPPAQASKHETRLAYIQKQGVTKKLALKILTCLDRQAIINQIPIRLLLAVITKESTFRPNARSLDGSQGLMQVRTHVHKKLLKSLGIRNVFDVSSNILAGSTLLKTYLENAQGNTEQALKKYSGGSSKYAKSIIYLMNQIP